MGNPSQSYGACRVQENLVFFLKSPVGFLGFIMFWGFIGFLGGFIGFWGFFGQAGKNR